MLRIFLSLEKAGCAIPSNLMNEKCLVCFSRTFSISDCMNLYYYRAGKSSQEEIKKKKTDRKYTYIGKI